MTPPDLATPPSAPPRPKKLIFGNYEIVDTTGSGGMGVVYRAIDMQFGRPVALKILRDDLRAQQHIVARFQREAEAIAKLNHPNIVHVFSVGSVGKVPYLAMEFIEGTTLGNYLCEHGLMPWQDALAIAAQIADALASAHDAGVIHRDIKPGNILLDRDGKAYVTDFGIAKVLNATTKLTVDGSRLGTPQYMSPERCKNKEITPASDIYSLGVLVYQAICGRLPYEANSPVELVAKIIGEDPVRITEYMPAIPENVDRLLAHMLDPNPKARPQSARTLLAMIERVLNGLPLVEGDASASRAIDIYRTQLEKESSHRTPTPSPQPKTAAPKVPWAVRVSRAWFQLSRMARLALAGSLMAALAGAAGLGAWQSARLLQPVTVFRLPQVDATQWERDVNPATVINESRGVDVVRLAMPGFAAARCVRAGVGTAALVELRGQDGGPEAGQYAVARVSAELPGGQLVLEPSALGGEGAHLLAAALGPFGAPGYLYSYRGRMVPAGAAPPIAGNAAAVAPLADGRWVSAHMKAGAWQLEVTSGDGIEPFTVGLPAGPVAALACARDASQVAVLTGTEGKFVLWSAPMIPGSTASEIARGVRIALAPEAFTDDPKRLVAVMQEREAAPATATIFSTDGAPPASVAPAIYAASVPGTGRVVFSAADRAGNVQLWLSNGANPDPTQLTFLGAGLAETFAVLDGGVLAAPVHDQPAVALVTPPIS